MHSSVGIPPSDSRGDLQLCVERGKFIDRLVSKMADGTMDGMFGGEHVFLNPSLGNRALFRFHAPPPRLHNHACPLQLWKQEAVNDQGHRTEMPLNDCNLIIKPRFIHILAWCPWEHIFLRDHIWLHHLSVVVRLSFPLAIAILLTSNYYDCTEFYPAITAQ